MGEEGSGSGMGEREWTETRNKTLFQARLMFINPRDL